MLHQLQVCRPSSTALLTLYFFLMPETFSMCGFAPPFIFFPNSTSPITGSDLEFAAPTNCLMDPRVHKAWLWYSESTAPASKLHCSHPPCLKDRRRSSSVCGRCDVAGIAAQHCVCVVSEPLCPLMGSGAGAVSGQPRLALVCVAGDLW